MATIVASLLLLVLLTFPSSVDPATSSQQMTSDPDPWVLVSLLEEDPTDIHEPIYSESCWLASRMWRGVGSR